MTILVTGLKMKAQWSSSPLLLAPEVQLSLYATDPFTFSLDVAHSCPASENTANNPYRGEEGVCDKEVIPACLFGTAAEKQHLPESQPGLEDENGSQDVAVAGVRRAGSCAWEPKSLETLPCGSIVTVTTLHTSPCCAGQDS